MKQFIFVLFFVVCLSSCKKEDKISPIVGSWSGSYSSVESGVLEDLTPYQANVIITLDAVYSENRNFVENYHLVGTAYYNIENEVFSVPVDYVYTISGTYLYENNYLTCYPSNDVPVYSSSIDFVDNNTMIQTASDNIENVTLIRK